MPTESTCAANPAILEANLAALAEWLTSSANAIRQSRLPESLQCRPGRDGVLTFAWSDTGGVMQWLGRTSMPTVSAPALVEAFGPGPAGILLYTMGSGHEVKLLLERIFPDQAIMVVEPEPWKAGLALRLHDLSAAIRNRRLLLFTGPAAWDEFGAFLVEHPGFFEPQRILSWPWFDHELIADITKRVESVNAALDRRRLQLHAVAVGEGRQHLAATHAERPAIAIIAHPFSLAAYRLAALLATAAETDWNVQRHLGDAPHQAHPLMIADVLHQHPPRMCILIDSLPGGLPYALPDSPACVLWTGAHLPEGVSSPQLMRGARLAVASDALRNKAISAGVEPSQVIVVPPAAQVGLVPSLRSPTRRLAVMADRPDSSPTSAGLHLVTHCRLWEAAREVIRQTADTYDDDQADDVVRTAESRLRIRLETPSVRAGIIERVRARLGPAIVREECLKALMASGLEFDLFGAGWDGAGIPAGALRGPTTEPQDVPAILNSLDAIVFMETGDRVPMLLLDALAAGVVVFLREGRASQGGDQVARILKPVGDVERFSSRATMLASLKKYLAQPEASHAAALGLSRHVRASHTWRNRLQAIARSLGLLTSEIAAEVRGV